MQAPPYASSYLWLLALSATVWEITRRLYVNRLGFATWLSRPCQRVVALASVVGRGTVPVITLGAALWAWATGDPGAV